MTTSLRWRARVLVEADRTSMAAAADRNGITVKTIIAWRKQRAENPELDALYEREDALIASHFRDGYLDELAAWVSTATRRASEMLPDVESKDLGALIIAIRDIASVVVQGQSMVARRRKAAANGLPDHRPHSEAGTDGEGSERDPRH